MKKIYFGFILACLTLGLFAQEPAILSRQRAEKIAGERKYNAEETAHFVEKAITTGINFTPTRYR